MRASQPHNRRVLAAYPSSRGFGFAVMEAGILVDWGAKNVRKDKNATSLKQVEKLLAHYRPGLIVLPDNQAKTARSAERIRTLIQQIAELAGSQNIPVLLFSQPEVRRRFFSKGLGTKHALAQLLAEQFPDELGFRLPPKRKAWMSEDYRMAIFDAVALALMPRTNKTKRA